MISIYANTMESSEGSIEPPKPVDPELRIGPIPLPARRLATEAQADSCFFRSGPKPGYRKALLKVTDRCDLRCAHCFVSATESGSDMSLDLLESHGVERLLAARVANVTVTGGEPLVHPHLVGILELLADAQLDVTMCTNAVALTDELIDKLVALRRVRVNVSLDGFSQASHGKFRGNRESFVVTLQHTRQSADAGLLKGILSTPHGLVESGEYRDLYRLAKDLGIDYLLMNPLSKFGRGFVSAGKLGVDDETMRLVQSEIPMRSSGDPEAVFIRFPNDEQPLSACIAGEIFYVFVNGDSAVCPYLVFAASNPDSQHDPDEFVFGNLFANEDFSKRLDDYNFHERYSVGANATCSSCSMASGCGKGCPAAVIARGGRIGDLDSDVCPVAS
jgi:radical SAM protein with 4Fe4S-binding SPASM domain